MEKMLHLNLLLLSLLLIPYTGTAQIWKKEKEIKLRTHPTAYSADIQNNFYLGFSDGSLIKYNSSADKLENFSMPNRSAISLIDTQNNLRPFLFYYDIQLITILDRFSSVPKKYPISEFDLDIVVAACPAPDGDFWVIENNPMRLKKINPLRKNTLLEVQVSLGDSIRKVQAYQNILIVADEYGIHTFDQFGTLIYEFKCKGLISFQLLNGELHAFFKHSSIKLDPFKGQKIETIYHPTDSNGAVRLRQNLLIISDDSAILYEPR